MEDFLAVIRSLDDLQIELQTINKSHFDDLDQLFYGKPLSTPEEKTIENVAVKQTNSSVTPQQTKKRPKRLTPVNESEDALNNAADAGSDVTQRLSARMSNSQLLAVAQEDEEVESKVESEANSTASLMPPPPAPIAVVAETSMSSGRPQRAAKLRSEKNLKEQSLHTKLRRPSNDETVKVKRESEQRVSQINNTTSTHNNQTFEAEAAPVPNPVPAEQPKAVECDTNSHLRVKVKREKMSCESMATTTATLETTKTISDETTVMSNTTAASIANNSTLKKARKKKEAHKPIKVERFSDLDKIGSPVSSRTRQCSTDSRKSQESQAPPQRSIYEDAVEGVPNAGVAVNETITMPNNVTTTVPISETTFNVPTESARMNVGNETFKVDDVNTDKELSMETARDGSMPKMDEDNSFLTEDEDVEVKVKATSKPPPKMQICLKGLKMPARTHELFNPLLQSPVKMRVEAFENAAQNNLRPRRVKEAGAGNITPVVGKLPAPALGRFLTPTQNSNTVPLNSAQAKKAPMSACKATSLMKTATGTNLKATNSISTKTLTRENSSDDFRKGLHQLAEERKKQREQKHLQAAQLREAKERERAERMAKLAKEREEKRIKKQQEKEKLEERKRLEMEELQRKLHQQEEAERLKKAKAKEQERELLQQMKQQQLSSAKAKQMMPPPPKMKYTFEMLHEDDSTDDEGKVSYKRPPVPSWSRSHVRAAAISMQNHCPTDIIDSFFSVAPTTPDLKQIFPNIDPSHLKRNSSVLWSTPPRYSELPKY